MLCLRTVDLQSSVLELHDVESDQSPRAAFPSSRAEEQQRAFEARNRRVRDEHFASARWWFKLAESFDFAIRLTPLDAPQLPDEPIRGIRPARAA